MGRRRKEPTMQHRPVRFGVYLDAATHRGLLKAAIDEDTSATALVERLIQDYLRKRRKG